MNKIKLLLSIFMVFCCLGFNWRILFTQKEITIKQYSGFRAYSDGSLAISCLDYYTNKPIKKYKGAIGDGLYKIKPTGFPEVITSCDMTNGGFTIIPISESSAPTSRHVTTTYYQQLGFGERSSSYQTIGLMKVPYYVSDFSTASLKFYIYGGDGSWNSGVVCFEGISSSWTPSTVTWNTRPTITAEGLCVSMRGVGSYSIPIYTYMNKVRNKTVSFYGLAFPTGTAGDDVSIYPPTHATLYPYIYLK